MNLSILTALILFIFLATPQSAHAYLDPGSISYFIQLGVAFLAGGLFLLKMYWEKMILFFKTAFRFLRPRKKRDDQKEEEKNNNNNDNVAYKKTLVLLGTQADLFFYLMEFSIAK